LIRPITREWPSWGLQSADVYGGVVVINFVGLNWRVSLTPDFAILIPITGIEQLTDLGWLIPVD
jgi:hypothetical protein